MQIQIYTVYEELETGKPGRKPSKINTAVHVGLSQSPIAYTSLRKILLGCNIPAPSASSLQKRANTVMRQIQDINEQNMKKRRKHLIDIN